VATEKRETLSPERLIAGALALIDREGLAALTIDRLGAEFSVSGMAIYKHLPSKDAILDGVVASLLSALPPLEEDAEPAPALERFYSALWRLYRAHPRALAALLARPLDRGAMGACFARNVATLQAAGIGEQEAALALHTLTAYTLGSATLAQGGYAGSAIGAAGEALGPEPHPPEAPADELDRAFAAGLAVVLRGLEPVLRA